MAYEVMSGPCADLCGLLLWCVALQVVEEVVLRGLRPCFPVGTPPGYAQLAASCWHATAGARPTFQEVIARLQVRFWGWQGIWVGQLLSCAGQDAWAASLLDVCCSAVFQAGLLPIVYSVKGRLLLC
jgi:hypothetical protein